MSVAEHASRAAPLDCATANPAGANPAVGSRAVADYTVSDASFAFAADPSSVGLVRRELRSALSAWGLEAVEDIAILLASELATNAVLHARTGLLLHLRVQQQALRITVADHSTTMPRRRHHGLHAATGRGLALVEALALASGTQAPFEGYAKGVWFELPTDGAVIASTDEGAIYGEDWLALLDEL